MNSHLIYSVISSLITTPLAFLITFMLTYEWRYPLSKMLRIAAAYLSVIAIFNLICFHYLGVNYSTKLLISLMNILECILFNYLYAKNRPIQLLFSYNNSCIFILLSDTLTGLLVPRTGLAHIIAKLFIFGTVALIIFIWLRPHFLELITHASSQSKWYTLLPSFLCLLLFFIVQGKGLIYNAPQLRPVLLLFCFCAIFAYIPYFMAFCNIQRQGKMEAERNALMAQLQSYEKQITFMKETDEQMAIFHHDLRHFYQLQSDCLSRNDVDGALEALQSVFHSMDHAILRKTMAHKYTGHPTLDSMISYYASKMDEDGISFSVRSQITQLPAESTEFAVVLSNALENAYHACLIQPKEQARCVKLLSSESIGRLYLEISNTYDGDITFDSFGIPVSKLENHGYGTKSISYYVRKNGGQMKFFTDNGWFHLQLVLLLEQQKQSS